MTKKILFISLLLLFGLPCFSAFGRFSPNSKFFLECTSDKIKVWDTETGILKSSLNYKTAFLRFDRPHFKIESIYRLHGITSSGKYALITFKGTEKYYKKVEKKRFTIRINLEKGISESMSNSSFKYSLNQYIIHPTKDEYFIYNTNYSKARAKISQGSFVDKSYQSVMIDLDKSKTYSRGYPGNLYINITGTELLLTQLKSHRLYSTQDLNAKPKKSKLPTKGFYFCMSGDFTKAFIHSKKGYEVVSTQSKMPKNQTWSKPDLPNEQVSFSQDGTKIVYYENGILTFYDIQTSKELNKINLPEEKKIKVIDANYSLNFSKIFIQTSDEKAFYNGITGEKLHTLMGDDEYLKEAKTLFAKAEYQATLDVLEKVSSSELEKEDALNLIFKSQGRLGEYNQAAKSLLRLGNKLKGPDYNEAIEYYAKGEYPREAMKYLKELQQCDIRNTADGLSKQGFYEALKDREDFKDLQAKTKMLDDMGSLSEIPSKELFANKVGLFELYLAEGYGILKNYKDYGIEEAIKKANVSFTFARNYADLGSNRAVCYDAMGSAYLKVGKSLEAITEFENGINEDNRTRYAFVELAAAYLDVRGIIGDELRPKKQVFWPSVYYKDYKKITKRGTELLEEYVKEFNSDPLGYYLLAQYQFGLKYDYFKKRMMHARTAARLFKEKKLEVPAFCTLMQDKYFGARVVVNENKASDCNTKCGTCHGKGLKSSSDRCTSCNGSGTKGSCYSCDGRGRKYFTSNIQFCHTCSGKGRIACYMCNGSGKKHSHNHCSTCSGSGYHCE